MADAFVMTLKTLVRDRGLFVWALAFPLLLSTMFMFMFANLDDVQGFDPVPTAVVADEAWEGSPLAAVVDALAEPEGSLLAVTGYPDAEAARAALLAGDADGVLWVGADGEPHLAVGPSEPGVGEERINQTILQGVVSAYARDAALIRSVVQDDPLVFADPARLAAAFEPVDATRVVSLTRSAPAESVRFYYALFGMAALFGGTIAMTAVCRTQPNLSPLGARRVVGALPRGRVLVATLAASWVVAFACLVVAFLYVRLVVGVDFAGREGLCVAGLALAALLSTALGSFVGALPKVSFGGKTGIMTGVVCLLSLFAGLYGEPCMELADLIAREAPLLAAVNPATVITDLFYSLYYYDDLGPYLAKAATLAALAAGLLVASLAFMRRQRYASI